MHPDSNDPLFIMDQLIGSRVKITNKVGDEFTGRLHSIDTDDPECLIFKVAPEPETERQFLVQFAYNEDHWDIQPLG